MAPAWAQELKDAIKELQQQLLLNHETMQKNHERFNMQLKSNSVLYLVFTTNPSQMMDKQTANNFADISGFFARNSDVKLAREK